MYLNYQYADYLIDYIYADYIIYNVSKLHINADHIISPVSPPASWSSPDQCLLKISMGVSPKCLVYKEKSQSIMDDVGETHGLETPIWTWNDLDPPYPRQSLQLSLGHVLFPLKRWKWKMRNAGRCSENRPLKAYFLRFQKVSSTQGLKWCTDL